ncbi:hypothetical protein LZ554_006113 [Drepanopeziza brunnea f. sp. 'monogermtubi']|nr:hypothetical protein LZ554_006113 [Drepanopeziza brunnea f. sp. 'monogermtubi']
MLRMNSIKRAMRKPFTPKLTREENEDLELHIAQIRSSIFALEHRIETSRTNLLTICRCLKSQLSSAAADSQVFSGTYGIFDLPRTIAALEERCNEITLHQQDLQRPKPPTRNKVCPSELIERPFTIPHDQRTISLPRGLPIGKAAALTVTVEGRYHLLQLKRKQLEIEAGRWEADVKYWGGIYDLMTSPISPSNPAASTFSDYVHTLSNRQETMPRDENTAGVSTIQRNKSQRKAVPVKDIVIRTMQKATSPDELAPGLQANNTESLALSERQSVSPRPAPKRAGSGCFEGEFREVEISGPGRMPKINESKTS